MKRSGLLGLALGRDGRIRLVQSSTPGRTTDELSIDTETARGESVPDLALIVATGQSLVSLSSEVAVKSSAMK